MAHYANEYALQRLTENSGRRFQATFLDFLVSKNYHSIILTVKNMGGHLYLVCALGARLNL